MCSPTDVLMSSPSLIACLLWGRLCLRPLPQLNDELPAAQECFCPPPLSMPSTSWKCLRNDQTTEGTREVAEGEGGGCGGAREAIELGLLVSVCIFAPTQPVYSMQEAIGTNLE